jgi:hypothetical protein
MGASLVGFAAASLRVPTAAGTYTPYAEEQRYVQALWPIHTRLEQSVERMGLLTTVYGTQELDPSELKVSLEASLASDRRAEEQLRALDPPPNLRTVHQDYLDALRLIEQSTLALLNRIDDGSVSLAVPMGMEGVSRLHALSGRFWPARQSY